MKHTPSDRAQQLLAALKGVLVSADDHNRFAGLNLLAGSANRRVQIEVAALRQACAAADGLIRVSRRGVQEPAPGLQRALHLIDDGSGDSRVRQTEHDVPARSRHLGSRACRFASEGLQARPGRLRWCRNHRPRNRPRSAAWRQPNRGGRGRQCRFFPGARIACCVRSEVHRSQSAEGGVGSQLRRSKESSSSQNRLSAQDIGIIVIGFTGHGALVRSEPGRSESPAATGGPSARGWSRWAGRSWRRAGAGSRRSPAAGGRRRAL